MDIDGAVVMVTGASSGIGEATARAASRAGARLVLAARREDRISRLADELGDAVAVRCDVTDAEQVARAVAAASERFGRLDVLVNNAGQGMNAAVDAIDADEFRAVLELDVVAPLITMQAVIPLMREQGAGSIVNVGSGITFADLPETGAYSAANLESSHAPQPQEPGQVAEAILDLVRTGAERADLVPVQFGGTYQGAS